MTPDGAPEEKFRASRCRMTPVWHSERPAEGFCEPVQACVLSARMPWASDGPPMLMA